MDDRETRRRFGDLPYSELNLRYFRFKCVVSVHRLIEFWMNVMKMHVERPLTSGSTVHVCAQFAGDTIGIRFEYVRSSNKISSPSKQRLPTRITDQTIVLYVDSVADYLYRAKELGFADSVYADETIVNEWVKAACLIDPNGIRIRLLESDLFGLKKLRRNGRLAHCSVPVEDYSLIEKNIEFYEANFPQKIDPYRTSTIKPAPFRLLDMERFVEELTTYVWMGNRSRKRVGSLCMLHISKRKDIQQVSQNEAELDIMNELQEIERRKEHKQHSTSPHDQLFLGLAFSVVDLEVAIRYLKQTEKIASARLEIICQTGMPRYISFLDMAYIPIEVSDGLLNNNSNIRVNTTVTSQRRRSSSKGRRMPSKGRRRSRQQSTSSTNDTSVIT